MASWYVRAADGSTVGPVDDAAIWNAIGAGQITRDAWTCPVGAAQWAPITATQPFAQHPLFAPVAQTPDRAGLVSEGGGVYVDATEFVPPPAPELLPKLAYYFVVGLYVLGALGAIALLVTSAIDGALETSAIGKGLATALYAYMTYGLARRRERARKWAFRVAVVEIALGFVALLSSLARGNATGLEGVGALVTIVAVGVFVVLKLVQLGLLHYIRDEFVEDAVAAY